MESVSLDEVHDIGSSIVHHGSPTSDSEQICSPASHDSFVSDSIAVCRLNCRLDAFELETTRCLQHLEKRIDGELLSSPNKGCAQLAELRGQMDSLSEIVQDIIRRVADTSESGPLSARIDVLVQEIAEVGALAREKEIDFTDLESRLSDLEAWRGAGCAAADSDKADSWRAHLVRVCDRVAALLTEDGRCLLESTDVCGDIDGPELPHAQSQYAQALVESLRTTQIGTEFRDLFSSFGPQTDAPPPKMLVFKGSDDLGGFSTRLPPSPQATEYGWEGTAKLRELDKQFSSLHKQVLVLEAHLHSLGDVGSSMVKLDSLRKTLTEAMEVMRAQQQDISARLEVAEDGLNAVSSLRGLPDGIECLTLKHNELAGRLVEAELRAEDMSVGMRGVAEKMQRLYGAVLGLEAEARELAETRRSFSELSRQVDSIQERHAHLHDVVHAGLRGRRHASERDVHFKELTNQVADLHSSMEKVECQLRMLERDLVRIANTCNQPDSLATPPRAFTPLTSTMHAVEASLQVVGAELKVASSNSEGARKQPPRIHYSDQSGVRGAECFEMSEPVSFMS
mmetsp:Transcript_17413/g.43508  ORF Transcript_17413/g.43508 Transcript_17413/m.43508 type:complete len:568 (-) Transcript_17413:8-1711(-)